MSFNACRCSSLTRDFAFHGNKNQGHGAPAVTKKYPNQKRSFSAARVF
jgi:hypothetical protein